MPSGLAIARMKGRHVEIARWVSLSSFPEPFGRFMGQLPLSTRLLRAFGNCALFVPSLGFLGAGRSGLTSACTG